MKMTNEHWIQLFKYREEALAIVWTTTRAWQFLIEKNISLEKKH